MAQAVPPAAASPAAPAAPVMMARRDRRRVDREFVMSNTFVNRPVQDLWRRFVRGMSIIPLDCAIEPGR